MVRPAWAHSCGCKSRPKLTKTNEAKRNCKRTAIPPRPYDKAVPHLRMRYQVGCQWCGSNSPIWLARCMGRRAITSRR